MTRPKLILGVLAAAGGGTLLWYAWLIVSADLPRGARVASWVLWLVATAAALTLFAYLLEFLRHREAVGREASWKPLPGLVLLWIGGVTAFVSFAFVLPDKTGAAPPSPDASSGSLSAQTVDATSGSAAVERTTGTASRSTSRSTAPTPVSTGSVVTRTRTATHTPTPSSTTALPSSSRTRHGKPTAPPGKPSPSTTTSTPPLITLTLP